ncbi:hypothetical protein BDN71DRAFT_96353 [Pleurotus eryngii]|uniref:Uncharacterized protein n=1 Tax=Pleurotus eryngii TaxID=5323 RepID=A0A9P6D4W3_PLEER|nr:hypothetical protein BDN71DRAFT_96353 [Pleurotus eryngii]
MRRWDDLRDVEHSSSSTRPPEHHAHALSTSILHAWERASIGTSRVFNVNLELKCSCIVQVMTSLVNHPHNKYDLTRSNLRHPFHIPSLHPTSSHPTSSPHIRTHFIVSPFHHAIPPKSLRVLLRHSYSNTSLTHEHISKPRPHLLDHISRHDLPTHYLLLTTFRIYKERDSRWYSVYSVAIAGATSIRRRRV